MKNFFKPILILLITFAITSIITRPTFAATCSGVKTSIIECDGGGDAGIWHILLLIIEIMSIGVGILALIGISIFGIQYLTAGGNVAKTTKAKRRIFEIVLGLVSWVILFAFSEWLMPGGKLNFTSDITNIFLKITNPSIETGKTTTTTVSFEPADTDDKTYSLSSDKPSVASVSGNTIKCESEGQATITATSVNNKISTATITCTKPTETANNSGSTGNNNSIHTNSISESDVKSYFSNHPDPTFEDIVNLAKQSGIDTNSNDFTAILAWVEGEGQSDPNIAKQPNSYLAYLCANVVINNVKDNWYDNNDILTEVMPRWGSYYSLDKLRARAEKAKTNVYTLRSLYLAFSYPYTGIHNCYGNGGNPSAPDGTVYQWYDNSGNSVFVY